MFIIHGWGGSPEEGWFPWLGQQLQQQGFTVHIPTMPDTIHPRIKMWLTHLSKIVGIIDANTYFVGHSIGCQAILRYVESFSGTVRVGGIVLVAPWMYLDKQTMKEEGKESIKIATPWVETPIDFKNVKQKIRKCVAVFSDNDLYVPLDNSTLFQQELGAKVIIEKQKGHFSGSDGITKLPVVLQELLDLTK